MGILIFMCLALLITKNHDNQWNLFRNLYKGICFRIGQLLAILQILLGALVLTWYCILKVSIKPWVEVIQAARKNG